MQKSKPFHSKQSLSLSMGRFVIPSVVEGSLHFGRDDSPAYGEGPTAPTYYILSRRENYVWGEGFAFGEGLMVND